MEGDQEETLSSPFWVQSSHHRRRPLSRSSSLFFNSGAYLVALIVAALAFVFVVAPALMAFASTILRPHSVKKSWDLLNLVLVLFAIVCGFLSRSGAFNGDDIGGGDDRGVGFSPRESRRSNPSTPIYRYSDQTSNTAYGYGRVRSSSSYPDLRLESSWTTMSRDERWRFHDDMEVSEYRPSDSDHQLRYRSRSWRERDEVEEEDRRARGLDAKNIEVDTFEVRTKEARRPEPEPEPPSPPPRSPSPPPPRTKISPPPLQPKDAQIKRKPKRSHEAIRQRKEEKRSDFPQPPPPSRPPPPPPPPPPPFLEYQESEQRSGKSEKKRGVTTTEFLISLRRKKKKHRQKSVENFDSIISSIDPPTLPLYPPPSPPPPPPPPPPLPSVFQNLFSLKKGKARKSQSTTKSQPPPPPPPPPPPTVKSTVRVSTSRAQRNPVPVTQKPPLPSDFESAIVAGNESPLIPIPPPPPPPPFRVQAWKFQRRGDFVRVKSDNSSRSASPEPDFGGEDSPAGGASPLSAAAGMSPTGVFCPSPDVDTKADNFIARFRAGLMLEKENSFRERDTRGSGKSRLGLETGLGREE